MKSILVIILVIFSLGGCRGKIGVTPPIDLRLDTNNNIALKSISKTIGIRIFWWNVAWGKFNDQGDLDHNIQIITKSNIRPDVLVLGEYKSTIFNNQTKKILKAHYPFQLLIPYYPTSNVGIQIYSIKKFVSSPTEQLKWYPLNLKGSLKQQNYMNNWLSITPNHSRHWNRSYTKLTWRIGNINISLVPVHLLEPWAAIGQAQGKTTAFKSFLSTTVDNPLNHQIIHLKKKLKRDFGNKFNKNPLIVLGDFNIPKRVVGISPPIYMKMKHGLHEAFWGNPHTFPSKSTRDQAHSIFKHTSVKIDHAFYNDKVHAKVKEVIHLKGSDHYPLYLVLTQ